MTGPRRIRIFVSSPGDVADERAQCEGAVQELNMTLHALMPERGVELELIRWETHTHPDLTGNPQQVVDDQIGVDYHIFLGIMWTRFGTPTSSAGSGTEREFRAAYQGWQERRLPAHPLLLRRGTDTGTARPGERRAAKSSQRFSDRAGTEGSHRQLRYDARVDFGSQVRRDLVLVVSRLLNAAELAARLAERAAERTLDSDIAVVRQRVADSARDYRILRQTMPPGSSRTRRMEVVARISAHSPNRHSPYFLTLWQVPSPVNDSPP